MPPQKLRSAYRTWRSPSSWENDVGFRLAQDLLSE